MELKFNGKSIMEVLAGEVQHEVDRCAKEITSYIIPANPIWSGRMVNAWQWSKDTLEMKPVPYWDGVTRSVTFKDGSVREFPVNPLPRPTPEAVIPKFNYESTEFPTVFMSCSVDWAYEVDQGVGRYTKPAHNLVLKGIQKAMQ